MVDSRGGAFMDPSADLLNLTGHHPNPPCVADCTELGTARSLGVIVHFVIDPTA